MKNRITLALAAGATLLLVLLAPSAVGAGAAAVEGTLTEASFRSATLNEAISYNVYLPAGYEGSSDSYPVLYLLHGRGDSKSAWCTSLTSCSRSAWRRRSTSEPLASRSERCSKSDAASR